MISVNELRTKVEGLYWVDLDIQGFEILSLERTIHKRKAF